MNTFAAILKREEAATRQQKMKVFDWVAAANYIKQNNVKNAMAGLSTDLEWTSGEILKDGKPVLDSYTYLASIWATPVLVLTDEFDKEVPCYLYEDETEYTEDTRWPQEALDILNT